MMAREAIHSGELKHGEYINVTWGVRNGCSSCKKGSTILPLLFWCHHFHIHVFDDALCLAHEPIKEELNGVF